MAEQSIAVSLTVLPEDQNEAVRVIETLSRAAAGLAFDGLAVSLNIGTYEVEEDEE